MSMMVSILVYAAMVAAVLFASLHYIHMLQLESYQGKMYLKWLKRHFSNDCVPFLLAGVAGTALRVGYVLFSANSQTLANILWYAGDAVYVLMLAFLGFVNLKKPQKKPLKFTGRVIRLLVALAVVTIPFCFALFLQYDISHWGGYLAVTVLRYLPGMLLPLFLMLAYLITYPIEWAVKRWYFNDARRKLAAREDVIRLAITGSYGKTSTKFILGAILSQRYATLVTPGSYNTPMGVTRVIREQLTREHKAFVAEMGARYKGDIKELCRLVQPQYGIITAVGKQHLETFGSFEAVAATKGELLFGMAEGGVAFLNGDNQTCRAMADTCPVEVHLFGLEGEGLYMRAENIQVGSFGSRFILAAQDGGSVECETKLLGRHNILNITGAAACAYRLGLSLEEIAMGIAGLEPVEHRLQLIPGPITVIDDAFNANPEGSRYAMDVLCSFPGRRIVVTPGMVELGHEEEAQNQAFGEYMASRTDVVILVGKAHVEPIRQGLLAGGFTPENIHQVESLSDASAALPLYTEPGCVVLFENDLPDNYDE